MASLSRKKLNEIRSHHPVLPVLHGSLICFDGKAVALLERWNTDHVLKYIGPCLQFHVSFFLKQCRTKLTLGFVQLTEFKPACRLEDHNWIGNNWGLREYNFEQLCELVYEAEAAEEVEEVEEVNAAQKDKTRREDEMLQEKQALKLESAAFKLESALFEAESALFEEKRALLAEKKALFMKRQALIIAKGDFANESQMFEAKQAHFLE